MNDLLVQIEQHNLTGIAYADDLVVVLCGESLDEIRSKFDTAVEIITGWCERSGLELSADKTQLLSIGEADLSPIEFRVKDRVLKFSASIRYLGIQLDRQLNFSQHLNFLEEKTNSQIRLINTLNSLNPSLSLKFKRTIYRQVFLPAITYSFENWFHKLRADQMKILRRYQRQYLLALTHCYSTTSLDKLCKILGVLELDEEISFLSEHRLADRIERQSAYQLLLLEKETIYRDLEECRSRQLLWFITEHGPFKSYLFRFGRVTDERCRFCEGHCAETAIHLIKECDALSDLRSFDVETCEDMLPFEELARKICDRITKLSNF